MAIVLRAGGQDAALRVSSFWSSSPSFSLRFSQNTTRPTSSQLTFPLMSSKLASSSRSLITCATVQESSATTDEKKEVKPAAQKATPAKTKPPAKAPAKPLPEMMEEDVIPSLKGILEAQEDLTDIELTFQDNKLEGSFSKKGFPYSFWAFFPQGDLTGPKGFSLSSYGSEASTVEPFLIDEKRITSNLVVFWVEKRLAAQGIIPVWKE
ncbi:Glyceraldehyde-3-phosphate dehydrogenase A [Quillaja saponaria]|uniref:Glyceraldehyde-3-phosphate dehydrogenase A n=1 Tax=Quillaja saponaria TaxID=32244 RepID=A0AAD7L308_QUISA|nr:Glyceraldehyde-3-phosphate dehydrogenase A [Quillaja saponaria]